MLWNRRLPKTELGNPLSFQVLSSPLGRRMELVESEEKHLDHGFCVVIKELLVIIVDHVKLKPVISYVYHCINAISSRSLYRLLIMK